MYLYLYISTPNRTKHLTEIQSSRNENIMPLFLTWPQVQVPSQANGGCALNCRPPGLVNLSQEFERCERRLWRVSVFPAHQGWAADTGPTSGIKNALSGPTRGNGPDDARGDEERLLDDARGDECLTYRPAVFFSFLFLWAGDERIEYWLSRRTGPQTVGCFEIYFLFFQGILIRDSLYAR